MPEVRRAVLRSCTPRLAPRPRWPPRHRAPRPAKSSIWRLRSRDRYRARPARRSGAARRGLSRGQRAASWCAKRARRIVTARPLSGGCVWPRGGAGRARSPTWPPSGGSGAVRRDVASGGRPNPQMQPTGRDGPGLRSGAAFLVAKQWKRSFVRARVGSPAADWQSVRRLCRLRSAVPLRMPL
jgi:hypothetical protein